MNLIQGNLSSICRDEQRLFVLVISAVVTLIVSGCLQDEILMTSPAPNASMIVIIDPASDLANTAKVINTLNDSKLKYFLTLE